MKHGFFQDDNGNLSISRLLPFIIIMVLLVLTALYSSEEKGIPDIPMGWAGVALSIYGVNKWLTPIKEPKL